MWSMASPRWRAASMPMARFSFSLLWPVKSFSLLGRRLASNWASPSWAEAETTRGSAIRFSLPYQFQRAPEKRLESGLGARRALGLADRRFRRRPRAAQIEQRREHILLHRIERLRRLRRRLSGDRGQLVSQLQDHALGSLLSHSRDAHQLLHFSSSNMRDEIRRSQPGENFDCQRRSDPADRNQFFKQSFLVLRQKTVQRQRVLPHMRMNAQPHFGSHVGELGVSRDRDGDVIADAAGLHNRLIRVLLQKDASQMSEHKDSL